MESKGSAKRVFKSGATRDSVEGKPSFERSLSARVLERFAVYMYEHNTLPDGSRRREDNWQKGFTYEVIMDSMFRHFFDVWKLHRGLPAYDYVKKTPVDIEEALCGLLFNVQAYMHRKLQEKKPARKGVKQHGKQKR